jgi:ankyrin repeat protein
MVYDLPGITVKRGERTYILPLKRAPILPLIRAVQRGDLALVNDLLAKGANPNLWDENHVFPLHWAAKGGDVSICAALITAGADVNMRTDVWRRYGGHTPLHYCALYCALSEELVIKLLLDHGADPNLRCRSFPSSNTAMQNIILCCKPTVVFEVIDHLGDRSRFTKLQAMIYAENLEVVRSMLGNGFDAHSKVTQGGSVLAYAKRLNRSRKSDGLHAIIELLESHRH